MIRKFFLAAVAVAVLSFAQTGMAEEAAMLNVNTATLEQLTAVPGMTEELAKAIVSYRDEMGDIQSMDELLDVPGMTKDTLAKVKEKVGLEALSGAECSC